MQALRCLHNGGGGDDNNLFSLLVMAARTNRLSLQYIIHLPCSRDRRQMLRRMISPHTIRQDL